MRIFSQGLIEISATVLVITFQNIRFDFLLHLVLDIFNCMVRLQYSVYSTSEHLQNINV
jgi:hypothetical protein